MSEYLPAEDLDPLLEVARNDPDPGIRVAALDAASRFPLEEAGWQEIAAAAHPLIFDLAPGSTPRRDALTIAANIPLLSVRRRLREMAADETDPDSATLAAALASIGDPSQIWRVVEEIKAGQLDRLEALAAMPLEASGLDADAIPDVVGDVDPNLSLWRALALARLAEFRPLDEFLAGNEEDLPMFWGPPWAPYEQLATLRPLPEPMRQRLIDSLPATTSIRNPERAKMARIIIWACTGIADAEGFPLEASAPDTEAYRRDDAARDADTDGDIKFAACEATAAAERIEQFFSDPALPDAQPSQADLAALAALPPDKANQLVVRIVEKANQNAEQTESAESAPVGLGNPIIDVVSRLPGNPAWPVAKLAAAWLTRGPKALDIGQVIWVLGRSSADRIIRALAPQLARDISTIERLRLLDLIGQVGIAKAGGSGSPWRGAGPGVGATAARPTLIDDEPEMAAMSPSTGDEETLPSVSDRDDDLDAGLESIGTVAGEPAEAARVGARGLESYGAEAEVPRASRSVDDLEDLDVADDGLEELDAIGPEPATVDKRRVNVQLFCNDQQRNTFLAGAENIIRCWIGLPERERATVSGEDIQTVVIPTGGLPLTVQLAWDDQSDTKPMLLPASRTARTGDCDLHLTVPVDESFISADLVFLYRGRIFEYVRIEAFVIGAREQEETHHKVRVRVQMQQRQVIELEDRPEYESALVCEPETATEEGARSGSTGILRKFGSHGTGSYSLGDAEAAIEWLNDELFRADKSLVRRREKEGAPDGDPILDAKDPEVLKILRRMARHGAVLYNQLTGQSFADPGRRVQILNKIPVEYVPIEFVYDAGYPAANAELCDGWEHALSSDSEECPVCGRGADLTLEQRDNTPTICPLGFWSLQKIIERVDPDETEHPGEGPSSPRSDRKTLAALDRVVFAASHKVKPEDRLATSQMLGNLVDRVDVADDWAQWKAALKPGGAPLLLALPHHGVRDREDYLEIGSDATPEEDRRLSRGRLTDLYVNPDAHEPGPIVLLMGCETGATGETGYVSLARRFQQLHTSIVLGTLAKVLGRHAAPVAQEIVTQLTNNNDPDSDFGTIMRRVRRRMLAKGYLMALCLVALGDADWHLPAKPVRTTSDEV